MANTEAITNNGNSGTLAMSLAGLIYQAMSTITSYDMDMMKKWLEWMKQQAFALGGWDAEGKNLDAKKGLVGIMLQQAEKGAEAKAQSMKTQGIGSLISGVGGLAGAGATLYGSVKSSDAVLQGKYEDAKAFQSALKGSGSGDLEVALNARGDDPFVQHQIDEWATGTKSTMDNFRGDQLKEDAARLAKDDPRINDIRKAADERVEDLQKQVSEHSNKTTQHWSGMAQSATHLAQGLGQGGTGIKAAEKEKEANILEAQRNVTQQTTQTLQQKQSETERQANAFADAAGQIASQIASAMASTQRA